MYCCLIKQLDYVAMLSLLNGTSLGVTSVSPPKAITPNINRMQHVCPRSCCLRTSRRTKFDRRRNNSNTNSNTNNTNTYYYYGNTYSKKYSRSRI